MAWTVLAVVGVTTVARLVPLVAGDALRAIRDRSVGGGVARRAALLVLADGRVLEVPCPVLAPRDSSARWLRRAARRI